MAFFGTKIRRPEEVVAFDLGSRVTKAVVLRRKGSGYVLRNYALQEAPMFEKAPSPELLADHFEQILKTLGTSARQAVFVVGASQSFLAHAELPSVPVADLRRMVKLSPKRYLQQELPDAYFDCYVPERAAEETGRRAAGRKSKTLVASAKRRVVDTISEGARMARLAPEQITLAQVGLVNAFKILPEDSHGEVVALLDIGFMDSTISIVRRGELMLTRMVHLGSERFAQVMQHPGRSEPGEFHGETSATEAMHTKLQNLVVLLAREVEASIGFFVNQEETPVNQVYVSGGSARSQFILQTLETELGLPCEAWNPTKFLTLEVPPKRQQELEYDSTQLAVAIGSAAMAMSEGLVEVNFLAEEQEAVELRRRDPVRRGYVVAAAVLAALLVWAGVLGWKIWTVDRALARYEQELLDLRKNSEEAILVSNRAIERERTLSALHRHATNRFLWAPALSALQFVADEDVEFHRLKMDQSYRAAPVPRPPGVPAPVPATTNVPMMTIERTVLSIQAKNYGAPEAVDRLIESIAANADLTNRLRRDQPVLLKELLPRQVDPLDADRTFVYFTTECIFGERTFPNE